MYFMCRCCVNIFQIQVIWWNMSYCIFKRIWLKRSIQNGLPIGRIKYYAIETYLMWKYDEATTVKERLLGSSKQNFRYANFEDEIILRRRKYNNPIFGQPKKKSHVRCAWGKEWKTPKGSPPLLWLHPKKESDLGVFLFSNSVEKRSLTFLKICKDFSL